MARRIALFSLVSLLSASAFGQGSIDPELLALAKANPSKSLEVIVYLTNQQGSDVAQRLRPQFESQMNEVSGQMRAIHVLRIPSGTLTRAQEEQAVQNLLRQPPTQPELVLATQLDALRNQYVKSISDELEQVTFGDHAKIQTRIQAFGGQMTSRIWVVSAVMAKIPGKNLKAFAADPLIGSVFGNGTNKAELTTSAPSFGANAFWSAGFTGGAFDVGVLDVSAVQQSQPGFAGKRFESNIGAVDSNGHPTNCCGIMCSVDTNLRGVAYGLDSIASSMVNGTAVMMTNMNWMMTGTNERPENVNYSITDGTVNTQDYIAVDQFFDGVCDTFGVMVSKSTGNGGFGSGAPTITRPAPAYNLLACASLNDFANTNRADDRISSFSSRGPTPGGRKKPDVAAPGENITTLAPTGTTTGSGTSFSAPHIGGGVILLMHRGVPDPMIAKSILINCTDALNDMDTAATADDVAVAGSFWNRRYGWGYVNLNRALLHAADWFSTTLPSPPGGGRSFKLYKGAMLANDKATLTWNRHVGYNGASNPTIVRALSNLDLHCYNQANNALLSSSASTIDNVEQLHVTTGASVVLKVVTNGAFDPNVANERFALATEEGFSVATGPILEVAIDGTGEFLRNSIGQLGMVIWNNGDLPAYNVIVASTVQNPINGNNVNIGTIMPGESKVHFFNFMCPSVPGEYVTIGTATSSSFGETFTDTGFGAVYIGQ